MIKLEDIIGMPPPGSLESNNNLKLNTMPVMEIIPCVPSMGNTVNLYTLSAARTGGAGVKAEDVFDTKLEALGFSVSNPILIAFQAENLPSDTFSNEYGETFLNKMTDVASEGFSELMQMTNTSTGKEAIDKIGKKLESFGGMTGQVGSFVTSKNNQLNSWLESKGAGGAAELVSKLVAGQRVDFPQIWKNSVFNVSYSVTVKLYNPKPSNDEAHEKYILGPLALILLLASPQSDSTGESYKWPYFHKIRCTGLFDIRAGAITNVTVTKGGDQQQIAWTQRPSLVDVRIDFTNMYSSMVSGGKNELDRPTLQSYLDSMREYDELNDIYDVDEDDVGMGVQRWEINAASDVQTRTTTPTATDPYETDLERILEEKTIIEEDIIDDANGKLPEPPPTSDLRSRDMGEIAVEAGGTTLTGELAQKTENNRSSYSPTDNWYIREKEVLAEYQRTTPSTGDARLDRLNRTKFVMKQQKLWVQEQTGLANNDVNIQYGKLIKRN